MDNLFACMNICYKLNILYTILGQHSYNLDSSQNNKVNNSRYRKDNNTLYIHISLVYNYTYEAHMGYMVYINDIRLHLVIQYLEEYIRGHMDIYFNIYELFSHIYFQRDYLCNYNLDYNLYIHIQDMFLCISYLDILVQGMGQGMVQNMVQNILVQDMV